MLLVKPRNLAKMHRGMRTKMDSDSQASSDKLMIFTDLDLDLNKQAAKNKQRVVYLQSASNKNLKQQQIARVQSNFTVEQPQHQQMKMMTKSASNDNFHMRPRSGIVHDGSQSRFKNVIKDIHHQPQNINSHRNNDMNEFGYSAHGGSI
jgi:hypothetical protein